VFPIACFAGKKLILFLIILILLFLINSNEFRNFIFTFYI
jgi:hypothetical protein